MNKLIFNIISFRLIWNRWSVISSSIAILIFSSLAHAETIVGKVIYIDGQSVAQQGKETSRNLTPKDEIYFHDLLTTTENSTLSISMSDGAKIILRPNTKLFIEEYSDKQALLKILQGGIRTVTGEIARKNPDLYQVITPEGAISVLGASADFFVRTCKQDCDIENNKMNGPAMKTRLPVIAKVVALKGSVIAGREYKRQLNIGYPIYNTEHLVSAKDSYAQLQFIDGSSVTIQADSSFDIVNYRYGELGHKNTSEFKLLAGGLRFVRGLIIKTDKTAFKLTTSPVIIGIGGTDFSVNCVANCNSIVTHVRGGSISQMNKSGTYIAEAGTYNMINSRFDTPNISVNPPMAFEENIAPPPSEITVDYKALFATRAEPIKPGTHVGVRKGYVKLFDAQGSYVPVHENSSAFSSQSGIAVNTGSINNFQLLDPIMMMSSYPTTPAEVTPINTIVFGASEDSSVDAIIGTGSATTIVIQEQTIYR